MIPTNGWWANVASKRRHLDSIKFSANRFTSCGWVCPIPINGTCAWPTPVDGGIFFSFFRVGYVAHCDWLRGRKLIHVVKCANTKINKHFGTRMGNALLRWPGLLSGIKIIRTRCGDESVFFVSALFIRRVYISPFGYIVLSANEDGDDDFETRNWEVKGNSKPVKRNKEDDDAVSENHRAFCVDWVDLLRGRNK